MLAGRYRLEERLSRTGPAPVWRAVDEMLEQPVQVQLLNAAHDRTADALDAARRAAAVEDPRLVRVLDVGRAGEVVFLVREVAPGRTLLEALADGPLPAETMRRLIGEAAQALARAEVSGLHHQRLTPESLVIAADGAVTVLGTAVEAALAGREPTDAAAASTLDTVGLVAVLYAGLTGRWPGTAPSALPPAPLVGGRCVSPVDLVAGVPSDLDHLCTTVLGPHRDGPRSPAELAAMLAPWAGIAPLTNPRGLHLLGPTRPVPGPDDTASGLPTLLPRDASAPAVLTALESAVPAAVGPGAGIPAAGDAPGSMPAAAAPAPGWAVAADAPAGERASAVPGSTSFDLRSELLESSVRSRRDDAGNWSDPSDGGRAEGPTPGMFDPWADLSGVGTPAPERDTLLPFVGPVPVERPPGEQSRLIIAILVGFVVLVLLVAAFSLRDFGSGGSLTPQPVPGASTPGATTSGAARTSTAGAAGSTAATSSAGSSTPSALPSPDIAGIQAIDPHGDGQENGDQARRAIDGDPKTAWRSNYYATAQFAGLKDGLGLVLDLGTAAPVQQVIVDVAGTGGKVELRTATDPGLDGSTLVATAAIDGGTVRLTPPHPVTTQRLILWFTTLPKTGGRYQLIVSEIDVR